MVDHGNEISCLRTPVELGSWFYEWQVCWLSGWGKHRLYYLVMLVKILRDVPLASRAAPLQRKKLGLNKKTPPRKYGRR